MSGDPEFRRVFRLPRAPRRQVTRELDDELGFHLDRRTEKLVEEGLTPEEARARAHEAFGDVSDVREYCFKQSMVRERTMRGIDWLSDTWQDLRFSARSLRKRPVFVAAVTLTLALGIGAATAVFTVVNAVLLKPLPFEDSDRLVGVWLTSPGWDVEWLEQPPATYFTIRDESEAFEDSGLWKSTFVTVTGVDEAERVPATMVTDGVLPLLRARPMLGRLFTAEDDLPGSPETVIVSHEYWQRRLGGDPDVVGRTLFVERSPREIIGVMPPGFRLMSNRSDIYWLRQFDRAEV
ncbi:MAG: ABC transporter permease, partial [Gemmatimonadetes bacterium]|nr:ABC transporter permease [Gemmatimonadota bacterium]